MYYKYIFSNLMYKIIPWHNEFHSSLYIYQHARVSVKGDTAKRDIQEIHLTYFIAANEELFR